MLPDGPGRGIFIVHARMLWSAGRANELAALLDEATKLYPSDLGERFKKFYTGTWGGSPEAALALSAETADPPTEINPDEIDAVLRVAKAIQSGSQVNVDAVTGDWMERAHHGAGYAKNAAQLMSSLRRFDHAFAFLRAYLWPRAA